MSMKKIIITLLIIGISLLGLDIYEYLEMRDASIKYSKTNETYKELKDIEAGHKEEITKLNQELNNLKEKNKTENKEYNKWVNLIEKMK